MPDIKAIAMPKWGLEMSEGTVAKWHIGEGDAIAKGQVIMDIETDKIANEVEADVGGVLKRQIAGEGETLAIGALLAVVAEEGASEADIDEFVAGYKSVAVGRVEASAAAPAPAPAPRAAPAASKAAGGKVKASPRAKKLAGSLGVDIAQVQPSSAGGRISADDVQAFHDAGGTAAAPSGDGGKVRATPRAKRLAKELGIDLAQVPATGRGGRVSEDDVKSFSEGGGAAAPAAPAAAVNEDARATPVARKRALELGVDINTVGGTGRGGRISKEDVEAAASGGGAPAVAAAPGENPVTIEPMNNMRKVVAKRLSAAKQEIPHIYLTVDVEIDALLARRKKVNDAGGVKASVNDFVIRAVALALKQVPKVNVQLHGEDLHFFQHADISMAVALEGGLITPIVRAADTKSVQQIAAEAKDLATRARDGKLKLEEFQGGTFSISNMGMLGIKHFDAVINPPQGAILAVGAGEQRMVVKNSAPAVATVMTVTMSCDHRSIDGALGAEFLEAFKTLIQEPMALVV